MINKKAQEEMVGFVMIMLVVAIIFLVFLGIFLRQGAKTDKTDSTEISQFLDSLLQYSTECTYDDGFTYRTIQDLVVECWEGLPISCPTLGEKPCDVLEKDIKEIIEASWTFSSDSPTRSYEFLAKYSPSGTDFSSGISPDFDQPFYADSAFSQTYTRGADKPIFVSGGEITISLEISLSS